MKKIFLQPLMMIVTALSFYTYVPAQTSLTTGPFRIADAGAHATLLADLKARNEKTFNHFTNAYPEAILQKVGEEKDGTHIYATINGNKLKAVYDAKGRFQNAVYTYPCAELSDKTADWVMQSFPGYTLFGVVVDVKVHDKSAQLVMIENRTSWKRVRITGDGVDVYEEYIKPKK